MPRLSFAAVLLALVAATANGESWFRFPYPHSPFVVANNSKDGLPDFTYFDLDNASLTPETIQCPGALQNNCTETGPWGDEKCGTDKLQGCRGGLYCDISKSHMKKVGLLDQFAPNLHKPSSGKNVTSVPRTRRNILQRAIGWLATHAPYFGCHVSKFKYDGLEMCAADDPVECPQRTYTLTCEGLVEMAYGSPAYGGGGKDATNIHYSELQPGDAITEVKNNPGKKPGINHFVMFREWVVPNKTARVYQMGGDHGTTNMIAVFGSLTGKSKWCDDYSKKNRPLRCHGTRKYAHLVDE